MSILINKEIATRQKNRFINKKSMHMVPIFPFKALISHNLCQDPRESFYIYQIEANEKKYQALIGAIPLESIKTKQVLPHEETYYERKWSLQAIFSIEPIQRNPILLITDDEILSKTKQHFFPQVGCVDERVDQSGFTHRLYRSSLEYNGFILPSTLCVADGHHRISALLDYHQRKQNCLKTSKMMAAILSASDVSNRTKGIVISLNETPIHNMQFPQILLKLQAYFDITKISIAVVPTSPFDFCMYYQNLWYQLSLKLQCIDTKFHDFLAIEVFREFVLRRIFCVNTYTSQSCVKVKFDECNITSISQYVNNQELLGFILAADPAAKILKAAREGRILEPNSTYFEPKFFSGMIGHFL